MLVLIYLLNEKVSLSSLNRHAVATRADVGISKAQCLKEHFLSIFPECQIDAKVMLYDSSTEEEILSGHPDFVLDCIDNIDTKVTSRFNSLFDHIVASSWCLSIFHFPCLPYHTRLFYFVSRWLE
jgi:tRNA A37 threonylcarbamoyladenosine dehydratase